MELNIFELKEVEENVLLDLVYETLSKFPILKNIYSDGFLENLVKKRLHFDNYLLWLLTSKEPYTIITWEEISKWLNLLKDSDAIFHFGEKLRSTKQEVFQSYLTELEFAGYYKEQGYEIELEPEVASTGKNPEFKIESNGFRVFFEAKNIFWEEILAMNEIETQIQGTLGKIEQPYAFSIHYTSKFRIRDVQPLRDFMISKLKSINEDQAFPVRFLFPDEKEVLAKIVVFGRPKRLPYGYLGASGRLDAFEIPGAKEIRRKISKKVGQLPKEEANVLIIAPGQIFVDVDDIDYALYGDEKILIHKDDWSTEVIRVRNGTFSPNMNTRLSAVIFFKKKLNSMSQNSICNKLVFHNPFAKKKLSKTFFEDNNVRQFIPIEDEKSIRMVWT